MKVFAIDPGNTQSALCVIDSDTLKPLYSCIKENYKLFDDLKNAQGVGGAAIEMIASYGMAVGKTVFDTCRWVGRFEALFMSQHYIEPTLIYRLEEKQHICKDSRAKDSNIRRALIDRFARHDLKRGTGTKNNTDWFYGFKKDIWAAYAVGITYIETKLNKERT